MVHTDVALVGWPKAPRQVMQRAGAPPGEPSADFRATLVKQQFIICPPKRRVSSECMGLKMWYHQIPKKMNIECPQCVCPGCTN